eukprot:TRINITY_DN3876_c0_g1_i1.p1 TRINITY_DN3876_c0_g1~~TRINITY_DN3876_c0_g1_i1.p1  ORF type:complete len:317 (-),score=50.01 TRINITY_DN3876_c0_g1_i1:131-1081(-)
MPLHPPQWPPIPRSKLRSSTASVIQDRLPFEIEERIRHAGVQFIDECGTKLLFPKTAISAASVLFHRFYVLQPMSKFDLRSIASACLYITSKSEENHRRARDIINTSRKTLDPTSEPLPLTENYWQKRDELVALEATVFRTLGFNAHVELPYSYLLNYLHVLRINERILSSSSSSPLSAFLQLAWGITADSFFTTLSLELPPHALAAGAIYMAARLLKVTLPSSMSRPWWVVFDCDLEQLQEFTQRMLELYEEPPCPTIAHLPSSTSATSFVEEVTKIFSIQRDTRSSSSSSSSSSTSSSSSSNHRTHTVSSESNT